MIAPPLEYVDRVVSGRLKWLLDVAEDNVTIIGGHFYLVKQMGLWLVSAILRWSMFLSGLQVAWQPLGLFDQR
ncbi:hypothetical protein DPMN_079069 [Dreissena polymorpha]|uniref:Uncharacterized protein n=1 Tax=Dreissena polymorpha TaxID=45954 RepID=A0A9D4BPQ2_DREPO|nr:hypothetical protein DPMN_079069 [Dreissena polymorpha]